MADKTIESLAHPYTSYEGSVLWKAVSKAVRELVKNGDLTETTAHPYVVGYICKKVNDANQPASGVRRSRRDHRQ
jgi:hypothetical protein